MAGGRGSAPVEVGVVEPAHAAGGAAGEAVEVGKVAGEGDQRLAEMCDEHHRQQRDRQASEAARAQQLGRGGSGEHEEQRIRGQHVADTDRHRDRRHRRDPGERGEPEVDVVPPLTAATRHGERQAGHHSCELDGRALHSHGHQEVLREARRETAGEVELVTGKVGAVDQPRVLQIAPGAGKREVARLQHQHGHRADDAPAEQAPPPVAPAVGQPVAGEHTGHQQQGAELHRQRRAEREAAQGVHEQPGALASGAARRAPPQPHGGDHAQRRGRVGGDHSAVGEQQR